MLLKIFMYLNRATARLNIVASWFSFYHQL